MSIYEEKWHSDTIRDLQNKKKVVFKFIVNLNIVYYCCCNCSTTKLNTHFASHGGITARKFLRVIAFIFASCKDNS